MALAWLVLGVLLVAVELTHFAFFALFAARKIAVHRGAGAKFVRSQQRLESGVDFGDQVALDALADFKQPVTRFGAIRRGSVSTRPQASTSSHSTSSQLLHGSTRGAFQTARPAARCALS